MPSGTETRTAPGGASPSPEEHARLRTRLEQAEAELELARETARRYRSEALELAARVAEGDAERSSLVARLSERERYVRAIHGSSGWRLLQSVRGLFGRRW